MRKLFRQLRRKIVWIPLTLLVIGGVVAAVAFSGGEEAPYVTVTAERGTVREEVSVVGTVRSAERLDLALRTGGRIAYVPAQEGARVRRGQTLVSLSGADLGAQLDAALASLARERARLDQVLEGARPEDVAVTEASVQSARVARDGARRSLEVKLRETQSSVDSALGVSVDQFFRNPRTSPEFGTAIGSGSARYFVNASSQDETRLEGGQEEATRLMAAWAATLADPFDADDAGRAARAALSHLQAYLADLAAEVNESRPAATADQAVFDNFKADIASARGAVNAAASSLDAARAARDASDAALSLAERQLALKAAPALGTDVAIQQAAVRGAEAQVGQVRAQIAENAIVSPVDGVLVVLDAQVGETASPAATLATVIADSPLEIEAQVPEADIAKISVDDTARVTLDAISGEEFQARVIYVAPAEVLVDGVATYKVRLELTGDVARLKPGMTADLDIATDVREDVVTLPQRGVITRESGKVVRVLEDGAVREVPVRTGVRGVDGRVEILEGLSGGETVVTGEE